MNNSLEQENNFLKQCLKIYVEGCEERQNKIDKAIDMLDLIIPELWNISNAMTYKIKEVKKILGDKENENNRFIK